MRPLELTTKIFLDSGDPKETEDILNELGFLDGQTTNPSLFAKSPEVQEKLKSGYKYKKEEVYSAYKETILDIARVIPQGLISIEVYADAKTTADQMIEQAMQMSTWTPNYYIKLPVTQNGLKAAEALGKKGIKLNMTLCFTQEQAAAVYAATKKSVNREVFVSPFIGRLDDINKDGMDLIVNLMRMYHSSDHHVKVLAASIRDIEHLLYCLYLKVDIITAPFRVLKEWKDRGMPIPGSEIDQKVFRDKMEYFKSVHEHILSGISYKEIELDRKWKSYDIGSELTTQGVAKFSEDWNELSSTK